MRSLIVKRSVIVARHKTSVSLEGEFWSSLREIAASGDMSVTELITAINSGRHHGNLSSAIRLFVLAFYREQFAEHVEIRGNRKYQILDKRKLAKGSALDIPCTGACGECGG